MANGPYQEFSQRLIQALKNKGHTASRSPSGICIKTLSQFAGASEQICRRYIRGDALPDYEKVKQLAEHLQVNPGWLLFGNDGNLAPSKEEYDEALLHYILKQSYHLYRNEYGTNDDYADFVLGLLKEVRAIDTSKDNLLKIIDLAISSISSYKETQHKQSLTV